MKSQRKGLIFFISLITIGIISTTLGYIWLFRPFSAEANQIQNAEAFLNHLLSGNELTALDYTSSNFKGFVANNCPNHSLNMCLQSVIQISWGEMTGVRFGVGSNANNSLLFYTFWSNIQADAIPVVLSMMQENGRWVVDSFRGFIRTTGENDGSELLGGIRQDNLFPFSS